MGEAMDSGSAYLSMGFNLLMLTATFCLVSVPRVTAGGAALAASSGVSPYKVPSGPQAYCEPCDVRSCPHIQPESCNGTLVKDDCGCCPRCDQSQRPTNQTSTITTNHTCADVNCRSSQICVLNIQGIPICRCPSAFWCRRQDKREVCGRDGRTYRSKCYLKVAECTQNRKIRVAHKGTCDPNSEPKKGKRKHQRDRDAQARRIRRRKKAKRQKQERGNQRRPKRDQGVRGRNRPARERFRFSHQKKA